MPPPLACTTHELNTGLLASWATIVGGAVSLVGLVQSRAWLTGIGVLCLLGSLLALGYARSAGLAAKSAAVRIEGRSIDSLNLANLRRRVNRTLVVQAVHRQADIEGEDLRIASRYTGYCRAERETALQFGVDSDTNVPFDEMECFAYDLRRDPNMEHRIRPLLIGPDGSSKKIAVPFLEPLAPREPFDVLLKCTLPGCMQGGLEYYTSTLSFDQDRVARCTVRLTFVGDVPAPCASTSATPPAFPRCLKDLRPGRQKAENLRSPGHG